MANTYLEAAILLGTAVLVGIIVRHPKTIEKGIGPWTVQALTVVIGPSAIIVLAMLGVINGETVAALLGGVLGLGIASKGNSN